MTTARDIMTSGVRCIDEEESLHSAATLLSSMQVGSLPICGKDGKLKGMITDRDIVVKGVAADRDVHETKVGEFAADEVFYVKADDDVSVVTEKMQQHQVRRLPVIDNGELVGIIAQADVARSMSAVETGETVERISE